MSVWRRKALETFYELRCYFDDKDDTIYSVFLALLPELSKAHKQGNIQLITKIYDFAEWCLNQKDKNLWNAAGVGFYEHLVDDKSTLDAIPDWIKPYIFKEVEVLFEARLDEVKFKELKEQYNKRNNTNF
jgi:dihydrofolate reductase